VQPPAAGAAHILALLSLLYTYPTIIIVIIVGRSLHIPGV